jgi:hypothetical protein
MLRKDDPVYYKGQLLKLLKEARQNGVDFDFHFVEFKDKETGEIASVHKYEVLKYETSIK